MKKLIIVAFFAFSAAVSAQSYKLIHFELQDQFKKEYTRDDFSGRIVIIVGADRKGSDFSNTWHSALKDSLKNRCMDHDVFIMDVADLRGVPFFAKGMVKKYFMDEAPCLMDWKGTFARHYLFEKDAVNLLIFDKESELVWKQAVTEMNKNLLNELLGLPVLREKNDGRPV